MNTKFRLNNIALTQNLSISPWDASVIRNNVLFCVETIPTTPPTEVNTTPVKNEYDALWKEFLTTDDSMIAMNAARRILEYYFLQVSGKRSLRKLIDEHKEG